ncbi:hypothetical protein GCK72_000183 [Caenorhabditis remanei]|uniref:Protein N-terminal glutamine amidohydrolase n=1 Tax=Caenorhabditis remanei TaxID=31234 RepID=A0A6A5HMH9_CAERE|nr:hypothetical protein GCK72_000183 [Caenorhabditis remanei]KAF1768371.1 hypothetical protein GCK72_000183 [Caenorhabditis remanei]
MIPVDEALYKSCYCEENVYKLCENWPLNRENFWAVLISNEIKCVPLWRQKSSRKEGGYCLWDYHVIGIQKNPETSKVFDLDSTLEWGVDFSTYWRETMNLEESSLYPERYQRKFRVIPAPLYLTLFSSDRSHMLDANGKYLHEPPEWPPIFNLIPTNLMDLLDMSKKIDNCQVMDEQSFFAFFA